LLTATITRQDVVIRACAICTHAGVRSGMTVAQARAIAATLAPRAAFTPHAAATAFHAHPASTPSLHVAPFDALRSRTALESLAKWCTRFSPLVALDSQIPAFTSIRGGRQIPGIENLRDSLFLDITGVANLFNGEPLLLYEIFQRLRGLGLRPRIAAAPTLGAAWAMAHFGPDEIARHADHEKTLPYSPHQLPSLAPLPIESLRLPASICDPLHAISIDTVGDLLAIPRPQLAVRFDPLLLHRIDQALGLKPELLQPLRDTPIIEISRNLEDAGIGSGNSNQESLLTTSDELLHELCAQLEPLESGIRQLQIELHRADAPPLIRHLALGRASRNHTHLWKLLRVLLENLLPRAGEAPDPLRFAETQLTFGIEKITLRALWIDRIEHQQHTAWDSARIEEDRVFAELLDTFNTRLGEKQLHVQELCGVATDENRTKSEAFSHWRPSPSHAAHAAAVSESITLGARPSILWEPPEPADALALMPDGTPQWIRWRSREHEVLIATGPERISDEWWRQNPAQYAHAHERDYFRVQLTSGLWLWIYRHSATRRWFVEGLWT
jgi:protein ImuB